MKIKKTITIFIILFFSTSAYAQNPFKVYQPNSKSWQKTDKGKGGKKVFANSRQIASKSSNGKNITAFPDVCLTPPSNPAGSDNINEPNSPDSDSKGSKSVKNDSSNQQNSYREQWYYNPNSIKAYNDKLKSKSSQISIRDRYNIKYPQKNK